MVETGFEHAKPYSQASSCIFLFSRTPLKNNPLPIPLAHCSEYLSSFTCCSKDGKNLFPTSTSRKRFPWHQQETTTGDVLKSAVQINILQFGNVFSFINYFFDIDYLWQTKKATINCDWLLLVMVLQKATAAQDLRNRSENSYKPKTFLSDDQKIKK